MSIISVASQCHHNAVARERWGIEVKLKLKLHGMTYSNYYNMVKAIMIEKGMEFEEVHVLPNQEPDFLLKSPMGKVPLLESEQGFLTETAVMIDYIDSLDVGVALYPADPFLRAKVRELIRHLELYIWLGKS